MKNALVDIIQWMSEKTRMFGWDSIVALDRFKLNRLLSQEYISRFDGNGMLPPIDGDASLIGNYKVFLQDFILDRPRLSFENANLNDSKARLRLRIIGGNQLNLERRGEWYIYRVDWISPLVGPELRLELDLAEVPGEVADGGAVLLDLNNSDFFELSYADHAIIQQLSSDFFKEKFQALRPEQRRWQLGQVAPGLEPLLTPESFLLRTQAAPEAAQAEEGDGAVLAFIQAQGGSKGDLPGANSDFMYLIPGEDDYSATVLFQRQRLMAVALIREIRHLLSGDTKFAMEFDDQGLLCAMVAVSGSMVVEGQCFNVKKGSIWRFEGQTVYLRLKYNRTLDPIQLKDNLRVNFSGDTVELLWSFSGFTTATVSELEEDLGLLDLELVNQYTQTPMETKGSLRAVYRLRESSVMELLTYDEVMPPDPERPSDPDEPFINPESFGDDHERLRRLIEIDFWWMILVLISGGMFELLMLSRHLQKNLPTELVLDELVRETVRLKFGGAITGDNVQAPLDVGLFGSVAPSLTTFEIAPLEPIIGSGRTQPFSIAPMVLDPVWEAKLVWGEAASAGSVVNGLYEAPKAQEIHSDFIRVKVTATDRQTRFSTSALVTVVSHGLQVSPLVEVCEEHDEVSLSASDLDGGDLTWRIVGATPHGRLLNETGANNTYVAGARVPGTPFIIDEIEVSSKSEKDPRSIFVITRGATMGMVVIKTMDLEQGTADLALDISGSHVDATWTVLHGPGAMAGNVYTADPTSTVRFVIIEGGADFPPPFGRIANFIILALPLFEHTLAYQALCSTLPDVDM